MNCGECGKDFLKLSQKKYFCSRECTSANTRKNLPPRKCEGCDTDMSKENPTKKFCTIECQRLYRSIEKLTGIEGIDYIVCPVCKMRTRQFNPSHAKMHGFDSIQSFCSFYKIKSTCEAKCDLSKGENNPAYNHGGKYSPFSKNFIKGYDEEWHNDNKKQMSEKMKARNHLNKFSIEYWLIETDGDEEKANELYRKHQTRDVSWFIEKYGEEEGLIRHKAKTEKWVNTMTSKSSEEIIRINKLKAYGVGATSKAEDEIYERLVKIDLLVQRQFLISSHSGKSYRYDFKCGNKIIEYNGDYWHCNPVIYESNYFNQRTNKTAQEMWDSDANKIQLAKDNGYEVLIIWETEYNKNKEMVIEQCIKFLTQ